jgi:threonine/homoserine/homoserine lactone efflux protein
MSLELYSAYLLATLLIVLVPGPSVTLIIANGLTHGTRAGLLNVAGTQAGLVVMIAVVGFGLSAAVATMGQWFEWLRLAGAAYLIWIGWKMLRSSAKGGDGMGRVEKPRGGFFLQGLVVALSNPKTLVFFGAFFPQFIDPTRPYGFQIAIMGLTALVVAAVSDSAYAVAAARTGRTVSQAGIRLMSRISGGFLIGGGIWLAVSRSR